MLVLLLQRFGVTRRCIQTTLASPRFRLIALFGLWLVKPFATNPSPSSLDTPLLRTRVKHASGNQEGLVQKWYNSSYINACWTSKNWIKSPLQQVMSVVGKSFKSCMSKNWFVANLFFCSVSKQIFEVWYNSKCLMCSCNLSVISQYKSFIGKNRKCRPASRVTCHVSNEDERQQTTRVNNSEDTWHKQCRPNDVVLMGCDAVQTREWHLPTRLHGVATQNNIVTITAVRT
jgi:hypothetical protein